MRTKEEIEAETHRLRKEYGVLFEGVAKILFRHDPMGINFEDNTDEYYPEARTILPRLKSCHSSEEVMIAVHEEFQRWFGPDLAGPPNKYANIAEEVWTLWLRSRALDTT